MKFNRFKSAHCASVLALSLGLGMPIAATAQEAGDETEVSEAAELVQDTVYVTARKRQETQLEIPVAVSAFSQANLDERGITNAAALSDFVPGFKFENTGQGGYSGRSNPSIRFRGVGVQVGSAASRAGALFWDGAYVADGIGILPLIDLAQTEVIKGPQTAFFGRNTFAGAVNFIPAEPTDTFEGRFSTQYSASDVDQGYNVSGVVSGPLTENISGRIAVSTEDRPGHYEFQDGKTLGDEQTDAVLGSLTYDVSPSLELKYSGYFAQSEDNSTLGSIAGPVAAGDCDISYSGELKDIASGDSAGPFTTDLSTLGINTFCGSIPDWDSDGVTMPFYGDTPPPGAPVGAFGFATLASVNTLPAEIGGGFISPPTGLGNTYEIWRHHISADKELDNGYSISAFYSTGKSEVWSTFDGNYGVPAFGGNIRYAGFITEAEDTSAEIRFASPDEGRLRYMVGLSYYEQDIINAQIGGFNPVPVMNIQEGENIGLFGSVDFDITDALTLSAEGRYAEDTQTLVYNGASGGSAGAVPRDQAFEKFMPRVILSWQPEGLDLNVYGSYSLSYLQGNTTGVEAYELQTGTSVPGDPGFFTPPQELNAFEIGVKQQVNSQFRYSVALYQMDWENQVFFTLSPFPVFASIFQPGDSEYTGLEIEGDYALTDHITLQGGFNFVDAELTEFGATGSVTSAVLAPGLITGTSGLTLDAAGNQPRYIPASSGNVAVDIELDDFLGMESFVRIDGVYTGDFYVDNAEYNKVDASWKVNLRAGVTFTDNLRGEIFGSNIFDDKSFGTSGGTTTLGGGRGAFGNPTRGSEWGIRLTADF